MRHLGNGNIGGGISEMQISGYGEDDDESGGG